MQRTSSILAAAAIALAIRNARGLEPADIVVICNSKSANSQAIARHYVDVRKIPANHLIELDCSGADNLSDEDYRTKFVPALLRIIADRKLDVPKDGGRDGAIKCLVTTYGLPLRVLGRPLTKEARDEVAAMQKDLDATVTALGKEVQSYNAIAPSAGSPPGAASATAPATSAPAAAKPTWQSEMERLVAAATAAGARIDKLPESTRGAAIEQFIEVQRRVAGVNGVVAVLRIASGAAGGAAADAARRRLESYSQELQAVEDRSAALAPQIASPNVRKELVVVRGQLGGLVGKARALDEMIAYVQPPNTDACLDSELTELFADQDYPRGNWLLNTMNVENYPEVQRMLETAKTNPAVIAGTARPPTFRTLLVTRLDGANVRAVQDMIDTTLKVEATGLQGKLYLDARGLHGNDAYAAFDEDLRRTAEWIRQHAAIDVVLEDTPNLLQAKDAPACALYCGWYSLHSYQDSAQWVKGAVGYHVASYEMPTLHDPRETGWVVNLLNRGFCGTLGATDEPYLTAFPKPSLFFPLLLSGQFTQGEVWELTCPFLSWRIGFVGDPLYNPFKASPRVKTADLLAHVALRNAYAILGRQAPTAATQTGNLVRPSETTPATTPAEIR